MTRREWVAASLGSSFISMLWCAASGSVGWGVFNLFSFVLNAWYLLATARPRS